MEYPETFKQLVADSDCPDFIGWGNPNAKILLLHNDPVINISKRPTSRRYTPEITNNKRDWENNIANNTGFAKFLTTIQPHGYAATHCTHIVGRNINSKDKKAEYLPMNIQT